MAQIMNRRQVTRRLRVNGIDFALLVFVDLVVHRDPHAIDLAVDAGVARDLPARCLERFGPGRLERIDSRNYRYHADDPTYEQNSDAEWSVAE